MTLLCFRGLGEKIKSIAAFSHRVAASTPNILPPVWDDVRELTVSVLKLWGEKKCSDLINFTSTAFQKLQTWDKCSSACTIK